MLTRTANLKDLDFENTELYESITNSDEVLDVVASPEYQAGDLVELSDDTQRDAALAICLGYINGAFHLLTHNGAWRVARNPNVGFVVPKFVNKAMLSDIIAKLPIENMSVEAMIAMSQTEFAPDRSAGSALLSRMTAFQQAVEVVTQKFGVTLDRMHSILTKATPKRYLTLAEMYSILLKPKKIPDSPIVLYAIYRAVANDRLCFRTVGTLGITKTHLIEVISESDVSLVDNLQVLVRHFAEYSKSEGKSWSALTPQDLDKTALGRFVLKARAAIDHSRESREFTPFGMVGPAKKSCPPFNPGWTSKDLGMLHFMRLWACYDQFNTSSTYHFLGSAILRATGKYADIEYLNTTVGWTFLQEVGYISPWDLHMRHIQRLPDIEVSRVKGFKPLQLDSRDVENHVSERDLFAAGGRHDWKDLPAFAIDSQDTVDIDDAISVEPTDVPEEFWIHIHVADPASGITPDSDLAKRAEKTPLNLYLSGHQTNMWGIGDELQKLFSLAPNRPCLTFSGKVNLQGELLDYKITPAILQRLVYMTPEEVNELVGDHEANMVKPGSFSVGKPPEQKRAGRPMTSASNLQAEDLKSLERLHQLANALHQKRLAKGAMPVFPPDPNVKAHFEDGAIQPQTIADKSAAESTLYCKGDPFIKIDWPKSGSLLVASTMRLAGEIAAQWCANRNIPLPYITQPEAEKNLAVLRSYVDNVYYPRVLRGETTEMGQDAALFRLIGADQLSSKPGLHFLMGVDGYAKVTSPLRRYSDLLAHWQIENAILQERETGRVDVEKLPFQAETLEKEVFPWMRLRQRIIRTLDRPKGSRGYVLQALVRAWKYPDEYSSPIPETFRFTVRGSPSMSSRDMMGVLDWFKLPARLSLDSLLGLGLQAGSVAEGDVFEVRLANVNAHLEMVYVEAVRRVKSTTADEAEEQPESS